MTEMRKYGTGTFVHSQQVWRLKEKKDKDGRIIRKNISMSVKQLSELFKVQLKGKGDSERYWLRFLKAYANYTAKQQGRNSPLQERIKSLETIIAQFKEEKRDEAIIAMLERELAEARAVPAHDIDHVDGPVIHPDMRDAASLLAATHDLDEVVAAVLNDLAPKPIPKRESLRAEMDAFIDRHKARGGKSWHMTKQYLDMFFSVTGSIRLQDVTVQHYREFIDKVKGKPTWGRTTQSNARRMINEFLKGVEIDHGLSFPFIRNPQYRISRPQGRKERWTLEQAKTALQHATGDVRLLLLCGLNFGWYVGDVAELEAGHFDGTHVHKGREKIHKDDKVIGSWLVWPETAKVLAYGRPKSTLNDRFRDFRREHGLPDQKALRKTVSQMLEDSPEAGGEQAARLYRCERASGNHGRYYSEMTPAQVEILDKALRHVQGLLFASLVG